MNDTLTYDAATAINLAAEASRLSDERSVALNAAIVAALPSTPVSREDYYKPLDGLDDADVKTLEVGDLLAVYSAGDREDYANPARYIDPEQPTTLGKFVTERYGFSFHLVVKTTPKSVVVTNVSRNIYQGLVANESEDYFERWGNSMKRYIVRLGKFDAIDAAMKASPEYAAFLAASEKATAAWKAQTEVYNAVKEQVAAKVAPLAATVKLVNDSVGQQVLRVAHSDFYPGDFERGQTPQEPSIEKGYNVLPLNTVVYVLHGRTALGEISETQRDEALTVVREVYAR